MSIVAVSFLHSGSDSYLLRRLRLCDKTIEVAMKKQQVLPDPCPHHLVHRKVFFLGVRN